MSVEQALGIGDDHQPDFNDLAAAGAMVQDRRIYFDYLHGRVMKVDISGDTLNPRGFDQDKGEGMVARIIERLRSTGETSKMS